MSRGGPARRDRKADRRHLRGGRRGGTSTPHQAYAGGSRARARQGKWLGAVPKGFARDGEGYLQPVLNPDHENGEVGYLEVRSALIRVDTGESYRSVASDIAHLTGYTDW